MFCIIFVLKEEIGGLFQANTYINVEQLLTLIIYSLIRGMESI